LTISRSWLTGGFYAGAGNGRRPYNPAVPRFRLFSRDRVDPAFAETMHAFDQTLGHVEDAKRSLLLSVRSGRTPGVPLAVGLSTFEDRLGRAEESMPGWRRPETENEWTRCALALTESLARARRLRLDRSPERYEELVDELSFLLDPLDVFADASASIRTRGRA
jgi:hypothetical protein